MNHYIDDDSAKSALVARLGKAGHQIVVPGDAVFRHQVAAIFCRIVATCW